MDSFDRMFSSIDVEGAKLRETDIYQLWDTYKKANTCDDSLSLRAEILAFAFSESFDPENWKFFYKPLMSWNMPDGTKLFFPDKTHITDEIINYWHQRAASATHPVLKMRYAGLVWTFCKEIKKSKPPIEAPKIIIDSITIIADKNLHKRELSIINKLKYGLYLAISINTCIGVMYWCQA